jgi:alcohol dehydrogenase (cytochrome c)
MKLLVVITLAVLCAGDLLVLAGAARLGVATAPAARDFQPVSEATLRNPAPEDWINWRRTDDGWAYSPLTQINRRNVDQLQLAWSWAMDPTGTQETTPLVYRGVMYLPHPGGAIQALNAATGDLIWEYRPEKPTASATLGGDVGVQGAQKNIAIFGDRVFGTTFDGHMIALDVHTGALIWDTIVADPKQQFRFTAGPVAVRGKLIAGTTGCNRYKENDPYPCFIAGVDAASGKVLWRTSTIALPGQPGGETWDPLPPQFRAGSDSWIAGTYDAETNTFFIGTSQAKPWARAVRGTDGTALYTNCTLALDPDTGKIKWYHQYVPGESHDMDEALEHLQITSRGHKSLYTMGKLGILWQIDPANGKFIHATDLGYQTLIDVDPSSGLATYRPNKLPVINVPLDFCPSSSGIKSWRAMAYSPQTNAVYLPLNLNCDKATFGAAPDRAVGLGGPGPVRRKPYKHPASEGNLGEFQAMDVTTGKTLWRQRTPSPSNTAALATAGGLAFGGDWDRHMYAYDAATGKILWQTRLPTSAQGFPISYAVNGRQFIAVPAGVGGGTWSTLIPHELAPEIHRPNSGNVLMVFALPEHARTTTDAAALR